MSQPRRAKTSWEPRRQRGRARLVEKVSAQARDLRLAGEWAGCFWEKESRIDTKDWSQLLSRFWEKTKEGVL